LFQSTSSIRLGTRYTLELQEDVKKLKLNKQTIKHIMLLNN